jgi:Domain of unknown function (DUF4340)
MRAKRLLPLAAVLIVLIIAVVVLKRQPSAPRLSEEVGFERLVPQSLSAAAISGIDLYQGDKTATAVRLRRQGDTWVATSYYNAPVKMDKISKFLDAVSTLEGELRANQAELLDDFRLEDGQALHLLLYTTTTDTPAVHLLAGKGSGRNGFMRVAETPRVYSVNLNLQSEASLHGSDTEQSPEAKPWLELQIQDIPQEQVAAVMLHMPARHFHFTLEKPASTTAAQEQTASQETPAQETASGAKPQWKLVQPEVAYAVKQSSVEGLVSTLRTLRGEDIVSPDKVAEYGLDTPSYRAILTVQPEGKEARQVSLLVGNEVPEQAGKRYVRLDQSSPIYTLPQWAFNQLFPPLGTLLTIDVLRVAPEDVTRVTWQQGEEVNTIERQALTSQAEAGKTDPTAATWRLVNGTGTTVDTEAVTSLLEMSKELTADDWMARPTEATGLEQPVLSLALTLQNGQTKRVTFGNSVGTDGNRYASLPETSGTFVIAAATYKSLTEALAKLLPTPPSAASSEPKKQ